MNDNTTSLELNRALLRCDEAMRELMAKADPAKNEDMVRITNLFSEYLRDPGYLPEHGSRLLKLRDEIYRRYVQSLKK
ncbi:hypothetical protein SAMN05216420_101384 [Nitrosospira sp. Nl5]|uniref:hypothetical protein n=1 Tax=Nitrosospira sp. Nl5 TaxID=200120 RepID=UPI000890A970|nr:hypothetical protein [Nitrosospira sp. Nl5]SCX93653.1 hypothetical protein SAMN05216420_101384 [Nitrosospira sp. Nl5]